MIVKESRNSVRLRRHLRVREKVRGTAEAPRLCVFRSNKHIEAQIIETTLQQPIDSLRNQALPPIWRADPVPDLGLAIGNRGAVRTVREHQSYAADRLTRITQHHCVCLGCCKYRTYRLQTYRLRRMWRPSGYGPYARIARIFEQCGGILLMPRTENKARSLQMRLPAAHHTQYRIWISEIVRLIATERAKPHTPIEIHRTRVLLVYIHIDGIARRIGQFDQPPADTVPHIFGRKEQHLDLAAANTHETCRTTAVIYNKQSFNLLQSLSDVGLEVQYILVRKEFVARTHRVTPYTEQSEHKPVGSLRSRNLRYKRYHCHRTQNLYVTGLPAQIIPSHPPRGDKISNVNKT